MYRSSNSEFGIPSAELDMSPFPARHFTPANSNSPSFIRGWNCISVVAADEALTINAIPSADGPVIAYNPAFVNMADLEDASSAMLWLPLALNQLCTEMLHELDEDGLFKSERWRKFRELACMHMSMGWDEIIAAADMHGTTYMAETLTSALFAESGLMDILIDRRRAKNSLLKCA
jgi:hypothetical protein